MRDSTKSALRPSSEPSATQFNASAMAKTRVPVLAIGMAIALFFPATIHVYMISVLRVPYPDSSHDPSWLRGLIGTCSILALGYFFQLARPKLSHLSVAQQCLFVSAIFLMLRQEILGIVMGGVFSTAYAYNFLAGIPRLIYVFIVGTSVVLVLRNARGAVRKITDVVAAACLLSFAVYPLIKWISSPFLASVSYLNHEDVYGLPLGPHILIPAYSLTIEAVVGCTVLTALVWRRLSSPLPMRLLQLTLIIMFIKGEALKGTLEPFFLPFSSLSVSFLSASQFFMEWIALSVVTGLTWHAARRQNEL
jgi:hypothetical protein